MKLRVKTHFDAAHHLPNYDGKCKNLHGHRWNVELILEGKIDQKTGMLVDFKKLKEVLTFFDHKCINDSIRNPTAENIVEWLFCRIRDISDVEPVSMGFKIVKLELWESPDCSVILNED